MSLTERDERWVKDMIAKSWAEGEIRINEAIYGKHPQSCPNWRALKYWFAGALAVLAFFGVTNIYGFLSLVDALKKAGH